MPLIGVRELKERTAEVLRRVREERTESIVTHEGRPVAMLLPVSEDAVVDSLIQAGPQAAAENWRACSSVADAIRAAWPPEVSSRDLLRALRR